MRRDPSEIRLAEYRRILVCGPTGSGKTTLAKQIAAHKGIRYVELDSLYWEPGWKSANDEVFFERIQQAVVGDAWVVDGNYTRTRGITIPRAELVIWLHFPLGQTFVRLLRRTVLRSRIKEELWPGCRENWRGSFFSWDSILVWLLKSHRRNRNQLAAMEENQDWQHVALIAFRRPADLRNWCREQGMA